jgi:hypothetical protein
MSASFFAPLGPGAYRANGIARGPWSADACHAGPVTALFAREAEALIPDKQLARLTVDIARPVPVSELRVTGKVLRSGRSAAVTNLVLTDAAGTISATAEGLHLAAGDIGPVPSPAEAPPSFDDAIRGPFPVKTSAHGLEFFADGVEAAYPPREDDSPGPTTMWMRSAPIVAGEDPSPFQRLCPLADCGNGISRNAELDEFTFVNPDLTVAMHRAPEGEWIASKAVSHWQSTGIGLSLATLYDTLGPVGSATQTLLIGRS